MADTITVYSSQDLTTLARDYEAQALDMPNDELTGKFEYVIHRDKFREAYKTWNHDKDPLLTLHDELSHTDIFIGKPPADRIHEALGKRADSVQLV